MNLNNLNNTSDEELIEKYFSSNYNAEWLGILLHKYTLLLYGVCLKYLKNEHDAKDAVQQIFLKVLSNFKNYKVEYFKSWLYMVAKNHCLMKLRETKGKEWVEMNLLNEPIDETEPIDLKEKKLTHLEEAILELKDEQKLCVTLFYLQKKSYTQITEVTNFNIKQVKSYIQNGKRNLKIIIESKSSE